MCGFGCESVSLGAGLVKNGQQISPSGGKRTVMICMSTSLSASTGLLMQCCTGGLSTFPALPPRRSAHTHHSGTCRSGTHAVPSMPPAAPAAQAGPASTTVAVTGSPGSGLAASLRPDAAATGQEQQRPSKAIEPAHVRPPVSWAKKLVGSRPAAAPIAKVAEAAAVSYARAVSPAAADAAVVCGDDTALAPDRGTSHVAAFEPAEAKESLPGSGREGFERQQVCPDE